MRQTEYEAQTRYYQSKTEGLDHLGERKLGPETAARFIRDVINQTRTYGIEVQGVRAEVYRDHGMSEQCRHHGCGQRLSAILWDISRKTPDTDVYNVDNEDARWRVICSEVALHGMEAHNSFRSRGSITGVSEISAHDLRRVIFPPSTTKSVDRKRGRVRIVV